MYIIHNVVTSIKEIERRQLFCISTFVPIAAEQAGLHPRRNYSTSRPAARTAAANSLQAIKGKRQPLTKLRTDPGPLVNIRRLRHFDIKPGAA